MNERLAEWIIEQTTDALIYSDTRGIIARWNAAATELFGFTRDEAVGASVELIIPERLRPGHWAGFNRAIAEGSTRLSGRPTLTRALHKSGDKLYVEMTFALVKDPSGEVIGTVAIARNAKERVERERALKATPTSGT